MGFKGFDAEVVGFNGGEAGLESREKGFFAEYADVVAEAGAGLIEGREGRGGRTPIYRVGRGKRSR